jgi:transaldolase
MAIYIDSAVLSEVQTAVANGWIYGITTNPTLLAKSNLSPAETYTQLAQLPVAEIYYQVSAADIGQMLKEAKLAQEILGDKLVVKIPPIREGFTFCAQISAEYKTCLTAIFSPTQALAARAARADYIAVYVNRATKLAGDGLALTGSLAGALAGSKTEILAASLKSTDEVIAAHQAGAHHLTLPFTILQALIENPLSDQAVAQFTQTGAHLE